MRRAKQMLNGCQAGNVRGANMMSFTIGAWRVSAEQGALPLIYKDYKSHAIFVDEGDVDDRDGNVFFIGVTSPGNYSGWPETVICHRYSPSDYGFNPGFLIVPEENILFVGAGTNLFAFDLENHTRLWGDRLDIGFFSWHRHKEFILMSAELEFGVWTTSAKKLWSTFVEPPWSFEIINETVVLDIMGTKKTLSLATGK